MLNQNLSNYFFAAINVVLVGLLSIILSILLIIEVRAYQIVYLENQSLWQFLSFDLFMTRILVLLILAIGVNSLSIFVLGSGLFSKPVEYNFKVFSLASLVWILLGITTDLILSSWLILPLFLLLITCVGLLVWQLPRLRIRLLLLGLSGLIVILSGISRLLEPKQETGTEVIDSQAQEYEQIRQDFELLDLPLSE